jgi:hypothetical protein
MVIGRCESLEEAFSREDASREDREADETERTRYSAEGPVTRHFSRAPAGGLRGKAPAARKHSPAFTLKLAGNAWELKTSAFCSARMEQTSDYSGQTVASLIDWDSDEFGVLIDYGNGEWWKYRVGSRDDARRELERIGLPKPRRPFC